MTRKLIYVLTDIVKYVLEYGLVNTYYYSFLIFIIGYYFS